MNVYKKSRATRRYARNGTVPLSMLSVVKTTGKRLQAIAKAARRLTRKAYGAEGTNLRVTEQQAEYAKAQAAYWAEFHSNMALAQAKAKAKAEAEVA